MKGSAAHMTRTRPVTRKATVCGNHNPRSALTTLSTWLFSTSVKPIENPFLVGKGYYE